MKIKINAVAITSAITGAMGIGYGIASYIAERNLARKLNVSLDELTNKTPIDIPDSLVREAVQKKLDQKVAYALDVASTKAVSAVRDDIHAQVRSAVVAEMDKKHELVEARLDSAISNLDMEGLKAKVLYEARDKLLNGFNDDLNDLLDNARSRADGQLERSLSRFNGKLDNELDTVKRKIRSSVF